MRSALPERLTISFPIWGIYSVDKNGVYSDAARFVGEHAERGFNCIRLDDGAGLIHDRQGNRREPVKINEMLGEYSRHVRQFDVIRPGMCDCLGNLVSLARAAKAAGVKLILSSWYYIHTFWCLDDERINAELMGLPYEQRIGVFAGFLDNILRELEERDLADVVAFAEIQNEINGLKYLNGASVGYDAKENDRLPDADRQRYLRYHADAIAELKSKHPDTLFAYDSYTGWFDPEMVPTNADVFNFHSYFLWSLYNELRNSEFGRSCLLDPPRFTIDDLHKAREGRNPGPLLGGWPPRVQYFANIDPAKMPDIKRFFADRIRNDKEAYIAKASKVLDNVIALHDRYFPSMPIVCGEGVSYDESNDFICVEPVPEYWEIIERVNRLYRDRGLWGTVVRTCCGPEDYCWTHNKKELLRINEMFLGKRE